MAVRVNSENIQLLDRRAAHGQDALLKNAAQPSDVLKFGASASAGRLNAANVNAAAHAADGAFQPPIAAGDCQLWTRSQRHRSVD